MNLRLLLLVVAAGGLGAASGSPDGLIRRAAFDAGARFGVPPDLVLAAAWSESRLAAGQPGGWIRLIPWRATRAPARASALSGVPEQELAASPVRSLEAAAALLAEAGRSAGVAPNAPIERWRPALVRFNGGDDALSDGLYADDVLRALRTGFVFDDGGLPGSVIARPVDGEQTRLGPRPESLVGARFASYVSASAGGYRAAPLSDRRVRYIVIHTTQSSFPVVLDYFRRPGTPVGAHYVVRASDGLTVQMIDERRVAFHDACFNDESIGIEHEGFVEAGQRWYSEEMYRASAALVRDIAARHGIPLDREHVLGHGETPDCSDHVDPGPSWDWDRFFAAVRS
jgi:hypothetical protein